MEVREEDERERVSVLGLRRRCGFVEGRRSGCSAEYGEAGADADAAEIGGDCGSSGTGASPWWSMAASEERVEGVTGRLGAAAVSIGRPDLKGQCGLFLSPVPHVRAPKRLKTNKKVTEWHTGQKKLVSGHTGTSELFNSIEKLSIFYNGTQEKGPFFFQSHRCKQNHK